MYSESDLLFLAQKAFGPNSFTGILVYGSWALNRADLNSDLDLIFVIREHRRFKYTYRANNIDIDVYAASAPLLEQSITADKKNNNNFLLSAFVYGRPLVLGDGAIQALRLSAQAVWRQGPRRPSLDEQSTLVSAVAKSCSTAQRLSDRARRSPEYTEIAQIELGHLFQKLVYAYCRVHGLWASAIGEMVKWSDERYSDLISLVWGYLHTQCPQERSGVLNQIGEKILKQIKAVR